MRYCPRCGENTEAQVCSTHGIPTVWRELPGIGQIPAGQIIGGRYSIVGVIGRGGFGTVYEADHVTTGHSVAVKVLAKRAGAEGEEASRRFFQEAATTSRLSHPNTVRVFDFGQTDSGNLFLAMERLVGDSLQELLNRHAAEGSTIGESQSIDIGIAVLRSLGEAHAHGLVHRDLKPANIFLHRVAGGDSIVKVLDFGIVKDTDSSMTQAGKALGTPTHMSPEQAMGKTVDARSDLYALGVVLYECLTGSLPFTGDNPLAVVMQHVTEPCEPLLVRAPGATRPAVAAVVERSLAKNPEHRFDDAAGMRVALQDSLGQQPSGAFPIIAGRRPRRPTAPAIGRVSKAAPSAGPEAHSGQQDSLPNRAPTAFESQETVVSDALIAPEPGGGQSRLRRRPAQRSRPSAPRPEARTPSRLVKVNLAAATPPRPTPEPHRPQPEPPRRRHEPPPPPAEPPPPPAEPPPPPAEPPPPPAEPIPPRRETPAQAPRPGSQEFAERATQNLTAVADAGGERHDVVIANGGSSSLSQGDLQVLSDEATAVGVPAMDDNLPLAPAAPEPWPVIGMGDVTHASSAEDSADRSEEPARPVQAQEDPVERSAAPAAPFRATSPPFPGGRPGRSRTSPPVPPSPLAGLMRNPFAALSERLPAGGSQSAGGAGASGMQSALTQGLQNLTRELERRSLKRAVPGADTASAMWLGDDARTVVYGDNAGDVRLVRFDGITEQPSTVLDARETIQVGRHGALIAAVVADAGGRFVVSACIEGRLRLWDPADGTRLAERRLPSRTLSMAISHDGGLLIVGCEDGSAHLLGLPDFEVRRVLRGHGKAVNAVAATSSRRLVATAGEDGTVRTWDPVRGGARLTSHVHEGAVAAVVLSRNARWVVSGGWDGRLVVWSARDGATRHNIEAHSDIVAGVAISPDEAFVASASDDRSVRIWDLQTGRLISERDDFLTGAKHLRFADDSRCVYIGAWDGSCRRLSAVGPL